MLPDIKRYLFQLNHPAHFHLFKNTIEALKQKGHIVLVSIKDKDILKDLVKGLEFIQISSGYRKNRTFSILNSLYLRDKALLRIAKSFKPDLLIGTSPEIGHISKFIKVPSLFFGEDDVNLSFKMLLGAFSCYPFFDCIVSPVCVNNGIWERKTVFYDGFQKLAYLHPRWFIPDRTKVLINENIKYFILRFSGLNAYHDSSSSGISNALALKLVKILSQYGLVLISSERELPGDLEMHRFKGNLMDMHHYLAFAELFIGDSQTMSAEAGLLGTPFIRYNNFVNQINYLNEIEKKYNLGFGIREGDEDLLFEKVTELLNNKNGKEIFFSRKTKLINEKIDVTEFMIWLIENYPISKKILKDYPLYQERFKY